VAAAHRSGSIYIANASLILALIWVASLVIWSFSRDYVWGYAALNFLALLYFYQRWSAPDAQHRQFHFLMMCCFMTNTAFYCYQQVVAVVAPGAFGMSMFWYKLAGNVIYEVELALVFIYALLFRRAKADTAKWRGDVNGWFAKAGDFRRGAVAFLRRTLSRTDKPGSRE